MPLLDHNVATDLRSALATGSDRLARYGADGTRADDAIRVHLHPQLPPARMLLVGANDFSAALAPLAAALGYAITIADARRSLRPLATARPRAPSQAGRRTSSGRRRPGPQEGSRQRQAARIVQVDERRSLRPLWVMKGSLCSSALASSFMTSCVR